MLGKHFESAVSFPRFVEDAEANAALWRDTYRLARVPAGAVERLAAVPGQWRLLVIVEDWCGDAVNTVPQLARLVEHVPHVELRVIGRDANPELMDAYVTGGKRSMPKVILLDEGFVEKGRWGPRPRQLQQWVELEGMQLARDERYRHVRRWYARDRGTTTIEEILTIIECAADPLCEVAGV